MVWPHWHHERWATIGCSKLKWVRSVIKKWANDKRNVGVVGWTNNQALALRPAHERRCAYAIFEGTSTRREANSYYVCRNPTLWEDETHTPKSGNLESFRTPTISELDCRGQNTSPWSVLYTVGKVLKCRCRKWPRMGHWNIYITSYGQKKGRESNWQFDSRPQKVKNRSDPRGVQKEHDTPLESSWGELQVCFRPRSNQRCELGVVTSQSCKSPNRDRPGTPPWESRK
jgi:hypothetical protein